MGSNNNQLIALTTTMVSNPLTHKVAKKSSKASYLAGLRSIHIHAKNTVSTNKAMIISIGVILSVLWVYKKAVN